MWDAIQHENCFDNIDNSDDEQCLEERVFSRLLSGLHVRQLWHLHPSLVCLAPDTCQLCRGCVYRPPSARTCPQSTRMEVMHGAQTWTCTCKRSP